MIVKRREPINYIYNHYFLTYFLIFLMVQIMVSDSSSMNNDYLFNYTITATGTQNYITYPNQNFTWTVIGAGTEIWQEYSYTEHSDYFNNQDEAGTFGAIYDWPNNRYYKIYTLNYDQTIQLYLYADGASTTAVWGYYDDMVRWQSNNEDAWLSVSLAAGTYKIGVINPDWSSLTITWSERSVQTYTETVSRTDSGSGVVNKSEGNKYIGIFSAYPNPQHGGTVVDVAYTITDDNPNVNTWISDYFVYASTDYSETQTVPWSDTESGNSSVNESEGEKYITTSNLVAPNNDTNWAVSDDNTYVDTWMVVNKLYARAVASPTISGYVRTGGGTGISGVVMNGLLGNPSTDTNGYYTGTVDYGWSGTVTPTKEWYSFSPLSTSYSNVTSNQTANYTGTLLEFTISGYVYDDIESPIAGVSMTLVGPSGIGVSTTGIDGYYSFSWLAYGNYTVTPSKDGYTFSPPSSSYTPLNSDMQNQNFIGTAGIPDIIVEPGSVDFGSVLVGHQTVSEVTVTNLGTAALTIGTLAITGTDTTEFTLQNDSCSNQTLQPSASCSVEIIFAPTSEGEKNAILSIPSDDPDTPSVEVPLSGTGEPSYRISGYVYDNIGSPILGVSMTLVGPSGIGVYTTGTDGYYSFSWLAYGDYTVTPSKALYTFIPSSRTYLLLSSDQNTQNYRGTKTMMPTTRAYFTYDADFDEGLLDGVEHETVHDQLQVSRITTTFPFIWIPNQDNTISKIDTITGNELGRYRTGPDGVNGQPSRTTVDLDGSVWFGNRQSGTVVKIGLYENGRYVDRNGNGIIETSMDTSGDGNITGEEILPWGQDECVLYEVVVIPGYEGTYVPGTYPSPYADDFWNPGPRSIAVDAKNNVWAGCFGTKKFYYLDGETGGILKTVDVSSYGHTPYGAVIDPNGVLWSSGAGSGFDYGPGTLLRLDPATDPPTISKIDRSGYVYGVGLDYLSHLFFDEYYTGTLARLNYTTGTIDWSYAKSELYGARGIAVTKDNHIWVVSSNYGTVNRYDNDGNLITSIYVGYEPTGVSVDAAGKVWVVNLGDEDIHRIDPATNSVDLTKQVIGSGGHYGYSDMTGILARTITAQRGTWSVLYDSQSENMPWGTISWNSYVPDSTSLTVQVRSSNDLVNWSDWETASNDSILRYTPDSRYLHVEVIFQSEGIVSPILYDLSISTCAVPLIERDTTAPEGSISINTGATYTGSSVVQVSVTATDNSGKVSKMRFSNDNANWSEWENYVTIKSWILSSGFGEKTVYAQFKDVPGNESIVVWDSIGLGVPDISVFPASLEFGNVPIGHNTVAQVTVTNVGVVNLALGTLLLTGIDTAEFTLQNDSCSNRTLAPLESSIVEVVFSPSSEGGKSATLSIPSDDPDTPSVEVPLSGTGEPSYRISGYVYDNIGSPIPGVSMTLVGPSGIGVDTTGTDGYYSFSWLAYGDYTVTPSKSNYIFSPSSQSYSPLSSDQDNQNYSGTPTQQPDINITPSSLDYESVQVGNSSDKTFDIQNVGSATLTVNSLGKSGSSDFSYVSPPSTPFNIPPGSSQTITVLFTPTSAGSKSGNAVINSNDPDEETVNSPTWSGAGIVSPSNRMNSYGDFTASSDTTHWYFEKYGDASSAGALGVNTTYGFAAIYQTPGQKAKLSQVFSVPSSGWYTAKASVLTDIYNVTKQQKVYLYLYELGSDTSIVVCANQVIYPGNGGLGKAWTWKDLEISYFATGTVLAVQVVGINDASSGVNGSLGIDYIWVESGAAQPTKSVTLYNPSFDLDSTYWWLEKYGNATYAGIWTTAWSCLILSQDSGMKGQASQWFSIPITGKRILGKLRLLSETNSPAKTQKVYLYVYDYDSTYTKIIASGNAILYPNKWAEYTWQDLQFIYNPSSRYNVVQVVGINPNSGWDALYFDWVELKQE